MVLGAPPSSQARVRRRGGLPHACSLDCLGEDALARVRIHDLLPHVLLHGGGSGVPSQTGSLGPNVKLHTSGAHDTGHRADQWVCSRSSDTVSATTTIDFSNGLLSAHPYR